MQYKLLKQRHPDYDARYWDECRAFYAGGKRLLGDRKLMERVFPTHLAEADWVYAERCKRAFYVPYAGEIIDAICAALFGEEIRVRFDPEGVDPFYDSFFDDTSPPKGRKTSLNELMKQQILTALICRQAWTLVDLPGTPDYEGEEPASLADEEQAGRLNAYACAIDPEMVLDWEETEDGELEWALVLHRTQRRAGLEEERNVVREEYTYYTQTEWSRYAIEYKEGEPPSDKDEAEEIGRGPLSFGRVPLIRMTLTEGMWAMGKILPIARAHFNLRNALTWAETKSLFPSLVVKLGEENMAASSTDDPDRAINQRYGPGYVVVLGPDDEAMYVGPDTSPFSFASEDCNGLRDEMHRVLHHMALSVDNSAAALQRSADSKQVDHAATAVILRFLGQVVREHVSETYEYVAGCRGDAEINPIVEGMEKFDEQSLDALIEQAGVVETLNIPSATFKKLWDYRLASRLLVDATDEDLEEIRDELDKNVANEDYLPDIDMGSGPLQFTAAEDVEPEDEDEDEEEEQRGMSSNPGRPRR